MRRLPIGYYSALPSHTLTPHSGTSITLCSTLTRCLLIGCLNHSVVFLLVLFLLWPYDTLTHFDAFVVFVDSLSYGPLIWRPDHLPYSFSRTDTSAELCIGPLAYSEDNNRRISQRPHFPISSSFDSCCTPQFCYLRNSSTLLILVVLWSS